jgi:isoleucyl-tRNA synthetase
VQPNFKRLGPRLGRLLPAAKRALAEADGGRLLAQLRHAGKVSLAIEGQTVELDPDDIQVRLQARPGWAAAQGPSCVVVLSTELTPELVREGLARDLVRLIQDRRKELNCEYTDRIEVGIETASADLTKAVDENAEYIKEETLAAALVPGALASCQGVQHDVADHKLVLYVARR